MVYVEKRTKNKLIRTFSESVKTHDLKWHCDKHDRTFVVKSDTDWLFQYDNQLPFKLEKNKEYFIQRKTFHRLIKGTGDLTLEIKEHY